MTRIAGSGYPSWRPKERCSPYSRRTEKHFAIGNRPRKRRKEYQRVLLIGLFALLSWRTVARRGHLCLCRLHLNREGIVDLKWSKDNDTIFLSRRGAPTNQHNFTRFSVSSGKLTKLTSSSRTSLVSYALSEENDTMAFAAERPEKRSPQ